MNKIYPTSNEKFYYSIIKETDEIKFQLRKVVYDIKKLSFEKGTRAGDYIIREKVKDINNEIDLYDNAIKSCEVYDHNSTVFHETLRFFEEKFMNTASITEKIDSLKEECINQTKADMAHNIEFAGKQYKRSSENKYRSELEKDIILFERTFNDAIAEKLTSFLNNINDLLFYLNVSGKINYTARNKKIFTYNDSSFDEFQKAIGFFTKIHIKLNNVLTEDEAVQFIDNALDEFQLKSELLKFRNIDNPRLIKIIQQSAQEYCVKTRIEIPDAVADEKYSAENRLETVYGTFSYDNLKTLFKDLCFIGNINKFTSAINPDIKAIDKRNRRLFYNPASNKPSLKTIAEYLRDTLLFINEWLYLEIIKNKSCSKTLNPLLNCINDQVLFNNLLREAYTASSDRKNQAMDFWGDLNYYISKETARKLIQIIPQISNKLSEAFVKIQFQLASDHSGKSAILLKKVNIIFESFYNSQKKIKDAIYKLKE